MKKVAYDKYYDLKKLKDH